MSRLGDEIGSKWRALGIEGPSPERLSIVQYSGSSTDSTVTWILFDGQRGPIEVCKLPRFPDGAAVIEREYAVLSAIQASSSEFLVASSPKPLSLVEIAGSPALFLPFLRGQALPAELSRWGRANWLARWLRRVSSWLIQFFQERQHFPQDEGPTPVGHLLAVVEDFKKRADLSPSEQAFLQWLTERATEVLGEAELALGLKHGDFYYQNVLFHEGGIVALDWNNFAVRGLPLMDLYDYLFSVVVLGRNKLDGLPLDAAFTEAFLEPSELSEFISSVTDDYCAQIQVPSEAAPILLSLAVMERANREYDAIVRASRRGKVSLVADSRHHAPYDYRSLARNQPYVQWFRLLAGQSNMPER